MDFGISGLIRKEGRANLMLRTRINPHSADSYGLGFHLIQGRFLSKQPRGGQVKIECTPICLRGDCQSTSKTLAYANVPLELEFEKGNGVSRFELIGSLGGKSRGIAITGNCAYVSIGHHLTVIDGGGQAKGTRLAKRLGPTRVVKIDPYGSL